MSPNNTAEIRYCEHAARVIRIEAPAITELLAAMAHLDKALTADPARTTGHYTPQNRQHLVPDWIHGNADQIRARLDALTSRYPAPTPRPPPDPSAHPHRTVRSPPPRRRAAALAKAAPKVIGVLTAPAPPTWWGANRHKVLLVLGLAVGFYLGTHNASTDAASREDRPRPAHTAPDTRPTTPEGTRP